MSMPTLRRFLTRQTRAPQPDAQLVFLIENIAAACRTVASHIRKGAFEGMLGLAGGANVQGEDQKTLDVIADREFSTICATSSDLAALVSEEIEQITWLKDPEAGDHILFYDPLDGSSNIDVNLSVGSIFSVCRVDQDGDRDVLRPGRRQLCAGYAIYGPALMLVLTTGAGVNGFTCDTETGEFHLTHPDMRIPARTSEFAINASRYHHWDAPVRRYVDECLAGPSGPRGRAFNMRWTASMVADMHRILTRGGVFLYPADTENREKGGKLRLLYEAAPMAMIAEQAGGGGSTGERPLLDLVPDHHHQRVPVILGSLDEVTRLEAYHRA